MGIILFYLYNSIFIKHTDAKRKLDTYIFSQDKGNSSSFGSAIQELPSSCTITITYLLTYLLISYCSTIPKTKFLKIFFGSTKITYRYRCLHLNFAMHLSTSFLHLLAYFADHLPTFTYNICKTEKSISHPIILLN